MLSSEVLKNYIDKTGLRHENYMHAFPPDLPGGDASVQAFANT